jgi:type IV pilus assembly protein PilW
MKSNIQGNSGFTLIEMMIAIFMSSIVIGSILLVYQSQNESYHTQERIVEVQQNLRTGLYYIQQRLRMAGYDPTGTKQFGLVFQLPFHAGIGTDLTSANTIAFTVDEDQDGVIDDDDDELFAFRLHNNNLQEFRRGAVSWIDIAKNIEILNFVYIKEDGTNVSDPSTSELDDIRSIQITIIARPDKEDRYHTDTRKYTNQQSTPLLDKSGTNADHFRRRKLSFEVKCRNLGL